MPYRFSHPRLLALLLLLLAGRLGMSAVQASEPVIIQGATTFNARLIEPFKAELEQRIGGLLTVVPNRSLHGLVALLEGRASLAMLSAPLEPELAYLRRQFPDAPVDRLQGHDIARTAVAFVAHPSNPVDRLSRDDIRRILLGEVTSWAALGGPDLPIKPVFVREGGGVIVTVQAHLIGSAAIAAPGAMRFERAKQVPRVVAQEPGALGITQLQLAREAGLKMIETDHAIEQRLTIVSLGAPTPLQVKVIEALRVIAQERVF